MRWIWWLVPTILAAQGLRVEPYAAEVRTVYRAADGLPSDDVNALTTAPGSAVWAATRGGLAVWRNGSWTKSPAQASLVAGWRDDIWFTSEDALWQMAGSAPARRVADAPAGARHLSAGPSILLSAAGGFFRLTGGRFVREGGLPDGEVRQSAQSRDGREAVASAAGLFLKRGAGSWERVLPQSGKRSWAPVDVRAVVFDTRDRLWFASPQGVGCLDGSTWSLYTGADGLPYDDFTTAAAAGDGAVWFGTHAGAIRFDGRNWEYRQGPRWLPDDEVRAIGATESGDAWIATPRGIARIERRRTTLAEKARFFEAEIDRRHRRTPYGYVLEVRLAAPGDLATWTQRDSDNDGLWTSMYGAGECFAAALGDEEARRRARAAFEALRFLGTVTQGGEHPAPRGFVARSVLPASGPDPNRSDSAERDRQMQQTRDRLWKSLTPRWPLSADRQWYWKADTSSDELDGHYFFYGVYYDLAARTEEEKRAVREHVAALTDHLIDHRFQLVDHDGKATRWGIFDPARLNHSADFANERGINSLSMLAYLKIAGHITGDAKYERTYRQLIDEHAYEQNVLIPKSNAGPGAGNQSDDEMIFMNYYGLLRYEKDAELRRKYLLAFHEHWKMEEPEMNPLFNFLYAAMATGESINGVFNRMDLTPAGDWLADSAETLQRFPQDRVAWSYRNSRRTDVVKLPPWAHGTGAARGYRVNGKVIPVDERYVGHWNLDPWRLDQESDGRTLGDGAAFLLPYYLGRYTGLIRE